MLSTSTLGEIRVEDHNSLLRLLLLQSERISDQQQEHNIILDRLTNTVILHEKRSTNLEANQAACRASCDADIKAAQDIAERVDLTLMKFYSMFRGIVILFLVITAIITTIAASIKLYALIMH